MRTLMLIEFKEIARLLRNLREQANLTLKETAERSELSLSFISDIERGRTKPSFETLDRLTAVYGYSCAIALEAL